MKLTLFLLPFLITTCVSYPQSNKEKITTYITVNKIDTFMVYFLACNSSDWDIDSCKNNRREYLFWRQDGIYYIKEFHTCNTSKSLSIDSVNPLTFYLSNAQLIDSEEIKQPTWYEITQKGNKSDTATLVIDISHPCYHSYTLNCFLAQSKKVVCSFNLEYGGWRDEKNIYYEHNQKTKFNALVNLTTSLIRKLKESNKFVPE